MPRIQDQVAENRRNVQRIDGRFIFVPDRRDQNLTFGRNSFEMDAEVEVYTRSLNDGLYSGHPDPEHGSGRGVAGDVRGAWSLQEDVEVSTEWTRDGRNAVRDALAGETGSVDEIAVGTGSGDAAVDDTTLGAQTGSTFAYGIRSTEAFNAVRARANFLYSETGSGGLDPLEYGLFDASGRLMARITTSAVPVSNNEEVRVDITVTISGSGNGSSAITDDGETAVADSLQLEAQTIGLDEIAWGTGTTAATTSDTALETEVYRATCQRTKDLEVITVSAPQFESQPAGQPYDYTEVGVFDNQGNLVWRTTMDPFEKTDNVRFTTSVGFRVV
ncbi:hypothetical protein M197_gp53 [Haloarcula hispanica tailed virus 2]|uniref:Uncharacterized protein n=1 Tax=Haloarcula hispanica tailed virus 2 TaxID=1273751 RepID=R4TM27_9CAUD|nr:hypothetical protein M197_gp53 [Haloarcula hispanica tailed virus 2]AGM11218.1 hypothetical protein HHTV2_53 [Haloarcula hispanica tailed virus 2]